MRYFLLLAALLLIGCTPREEAAPEEAPATPAADATVSDPDNYHLLDSNEYVRIIHSIYQPGETSNLHAHPDVAFVMLDDSHFTFTGADGTENVIEAPAGTAGFAPAEAHSVSNTGDSASETILVELIAAAEEHDGGGEDPADQPDEDAGEHEAVEASDLDATVADAERHTVEFENDRVRIIRYSYASGATSNRHSHPDGVLVPLTDGAAVLVADDGTETEVEVQAGQPFWAPAGIHVATNTSDHTIEGFLVEIKR